MAFPLTCDACGFAWNDLGPEEIVPRLTDAVASFAALILDAGPLVSTRPSAQRWSILEYVSHLRDVLISIRERIVTASIVDDWTSTPIHRDQRVELGFYSRDRPEEVAGELDVAARLLVKAFETLDDLQLEREFTFGMDSPATVTILWAGAQGVHECEHHLDDVRENLALLRRAPTR